MDFAELMKLTYSSRVIFFSAPTPLILLRRFFSSLSVSGMFVAGERDTETTYSVKFKFQNQRRRDFVISYEKTDLPLHYVTARRRVCYWLRKDGLTPALCHREWLYYISFSNFFFFFLATENINHILIIHIFSFKKLRK